MNGSAPLDGKRVPAIFRIREAAALLGVSDDTVRRWVDMGRVRAGTDASGRMVIDGRTLAAFAVSLAESADRVDSSVVVAQSTRNRFTGLVTRVVKDGVMAQVELQAGPFRIVSLISCEAAEELGLEPGVMAVANVKSTNVSVEIPRPR